MEKTVTALSIFAFVVGARAICPPIPQSELSTITCSNNREPRSLCRVECVAGSTLLPESDDPLQPFVECSENDEWNKQFPVCDQSCLPNAKADIVFVVDSSTSMRQVTNSLTRAFLREMIGGWTISSDYVNVAIVPYGRAILNESVILLNSFTSNKVELLEALSTLPANIPGSFTGQALTYVLDFVLANANGNRPDAPDIVLVMTDGRGQDRVDPPLQRLWDAGITTYAVGFHPQRQNMQILTPQLLKIAQRDMTRLHRTERNTIGDTSAMMNSLKTIYCMLPDRCGLFPSPENGSIRCTNDDEIGSECASSCDPGFSPITESRSTCVADGPSVSWTHPPAICAPDVCEPPRNALRNGRVACTNANRVGSVCTFSCTTLSYRLYPAGRTRNTCLATEAWDLEAPCCALPCPPNARMDGIIVLDSSSSIGARNWATMTNFVRSILRLFTISRDATNFAIARYNRAVDTNTQILLRDYPTNQEALVTAFNRIPYDGSGTNTGAAIQHVVDNMLTDAAGNRPGFPDVVIVITDGKSADNVQIPSDRLRAAGATVLVIGVEPPRGSLDLGQLRQIAGSVSNLFVVKGGFENLDANFALQISNKACGNPCDR